MTKSGRFPGDFSGLKRPRRGLVSGKNSDGRPLSGDRFRAFFRAKEAETSGKQSDGRPLSGARSIGAFSP